MTAYRRLFGETKHIYIYIYIYISIKLDELSKEMQWNLGKN